MIDIISTILLIAALIGVVLNIKKKQASFYIWAVTNAGWYAVTLVNGQHFLSILFAVYFAFSIWGIFAWGGRRPRK